jgi:hypothetical protein
MNRNTSIILTVATALLCGCPGLFLCIFGVVAATGQLPYTTTLNGVSGQGVVPTTYGFVMLCLALIFIAIPVVVGVVTLRRKPEAPVSNEPIPPAS